MKKHKIQRNRQFKNQYPFTLHLFYHFHQNVNPIKTFQQVYEPLLKEYCKATADNETANHCASVFLPHTMAGYGKEVGKPKIFYFGRDTNGWQPNNFLQTCFHENRLVDYHNKSAEWINKYEFLGYNKNNSSGFWTLAMCLHLKLKGIKDTVAIDETVPKKYYELLSDFGYGNTNAIEVKKSLENQGVWNEIDHAEYYNLKDHSLIFDKLKHTVEVYEPSLVFIFNWPCDETIFLEGLRYSIKDVHLIKNKFNDIHLSDYNTWIIWTVHPRAGLFDGYTSENIAFEIFSYLSMNSELK